MKAGALILPLSVLVAGSTWLFSQQKQIATLEARLSLEEKQQKATDRRHRDSAGASGSPASPGTSATATTVRGGFMEPAELEKFATLLARPPGSPDDSRTLDGFLERIKTMNLGEILAATEETRKLEIPPYLRNQVESRFIPRLTELDPGLALEAYAKRSDSPTDPAPFGHPLAYVYGLWIQKDPEKAIALLDEKITAGLFENATLSGHSPLRATLEGHVAATLVSTRPDVLQKRINTMPEKEATLAMGSLAGNLRDADAANFAKIVREGFSGKTRDELLAKPVLSGSAPDYTKVSAYLEGISATTTESGSIVERLGVSMINTLAFRSTVTREELDRYRAWAVTRSPEVVDHAIGRGLGDAVGDHFAIERAASLLLECHAESGSDELLTGFLSETTKRYGEETRKLAGKISDPAKRAEFLNKMQ